MNLPPLYHWSPSERRVEILQDGLKVFSEPVVHGAGRAPYLCFGTCPRQAWSLSGDLDWVSEKEEWDLWQIILSKDDDVHIRMESGTYIYEVRTFNSIPADRVWLVAQREPAVFIER